MSTPFFCSELSRGAGEKTFGTASQGDLWLLLEYPYSWGPRVLPESILSPEVKAHLNRILQLVPRSRLLFIKQESATLGDFALFTVRSTEQNSSIERHSLSSYDQLLELDPEALAAGRAREEAVPWPDPLFLTCTHGRRDKCCAKFGYPVYKALREHVKEAVWQSSHVGGDRFAANLVCFPHGLFYAHLTEETGRFVADEYLAGRLVLEPYRGRACYTYAVQAADYFVRAATGIRKIDGLRRLDCARTGETRWRVRFQDAEDETIYAVEVSQRQSEFENYNSCQATEKKSVPQFDLTDLRVNPDRLLVRV